MTRRGLFIVWAPYSRRSQLIAERLGLELCLIHHLKFQRPSYAPVKYILQAIHTLSVLLGARPRLIFVQEPPIFATLVVYLYCLLTFGHARFVVDAHSGVFLHPWWRWAKGLQRFLSRQALLTIVTNETLQAQVIAWGGQALVIADVPARFPPVKPSALKGDFNVAVVNTFSPDEPLSVVLKAAETLPDVHFYVTGDVGKAPPPLLERTPPNVSFTGFLPDEDYLGLLRAAQAVMVLTTHDHTLQLGACEAMALGRPLILSDLSFLRAYFDIGTIHVSNTAEGVRWGVEQMRQEWRRLETEIIQLREQRRQEWNTQVVRLQRLIEQGVKM